MKTADDIRNEIERQIRCLETQGLPAKRVYLGRAEWPVWMDYMAERAGCQWEFIPVDLPEYCKVEFNYQTSADALREMLRWKKVEQENDTLFIARAEERLRELEGNRSE